MGPPGRRAHGCWEDAARATLETHAPPGEERGRLPARMIEHRAPRNSPSDSLPRRTDASDAQPLRKAPSIARNIHGPATADGSCLRSPHKIATPDADTPLVGDEGDRFVAWRLDDASSTLPTDLEDERMERALLAYAHRSASRVGAEWFAAEFARRDEEERLQEARAVSQREALDAPVRVPDPTPETTLIDASVEDAVVGGPQTGLGLPPLTRAAVVEPEPAAEPARPMVEATPQPSLIAVEVVPQPLVAEPVPEPQPQAPIRHPHVPRPPAPEPAAQPKRRRRHGRQAVAPTPAFVISAPEWARMSPGARRLYGLDATPPAAAAG
jgi:hypothetical protein